MVPRLCLKIQMMVIQMIMTRSVTHMVTVMDKLESPQNKARGQDYDHAYQHVRRQDIGLKQQNIW